MKTTSKILLSSATSVVALLSSSVAFAQDATATTDTTATDDSQAIVVTGSLIRNPNLVQASPVNVTTADQIELKQSNTAEDVLRETPGVVANIGSAVNNGNGGSSYVDLRGLGSNRNIVLLDGNRIAPADLAGRVDLNNIPLALVSRVDALTGAAVTTYGADAITGVVNFVTKKDFSGLDLTVSNQITELGDGRYTRADLTLGANFGDGRGNAVLSVGYQDSDPVYQGARDFSITQISSYSGGPSGSGTGVPARFSGTRPFVNGAINTQPESIFAGRDAAGNPIYTANPAGSANGGVRQINSGGRAVATFAPFNFNPYNVFQTPFKRYNIFAQANYQVSDAVEVYTRGMFSKNTVSTIIAPSGSFGGSVPVNLNNPFLPNDLRQQFCAFDVNPRPDIYTPRVAAANCTATNPFVIGAGGFVPFDTNNNGVIEAGEGYNPNPGVTLNRRAVENGPRISEYGTQIFDYRIGARGPITDNISWDVNGSYGESENLQTIKGYTLQSRFRQASTATLVNGVPTCTDTSNGCVPVNLFGDAGSITPAMAAFLTANSSTRVKTTLAQARGVISGDTGFSLGGAEPVSFAIGTEFRKYGAVQASDTLAKTAGELGGAGGAAPDIDGGYKVYEGFGELVIPLIGDMLTVEGGARYSHYEVEGGGKTNAWTYKVGGTFQPISDIKIRGNYARAVRAPNIGELFTPNNTVLTNLGVDPCAGNAPVVNANLRAVCIAQGAPSGTIGSITNPTSAQANITTAGNLNLAPEKATTWTVGAVLQPSFLPRFNLSLDYYNIKVKDVIGAPLPGDLVSACFGSITAASATSPACTVIRRNPLTGGLDGDSATTPGLFAPLTNQGKLFTDGFDLIANYSRDFGSIGWSMNFVGNYTRHSKFQATPTGLDRECVNYYSVNCSFTGSIQPKYQFSLRNTFSVDKVDVSLLWRWINGVDFEPQQLADDLAAAVAAGTNATTGCPDPTGTDPNGCMVEPEFRHIPAESYFDLSVRYNVTDNFQFTVTAQNLLNNKPYVVGNSLGNTAYNSGNVYPSTYDALGRRYAVAAKLKF